MAELIDKKVLLESLEQTEKELENAMTCPSWWNALCIIEEQQAVAKEDIRAAAIDEFAEKMKIKRRKAEYFGHDRAKNGRDVAVSRRAYRSLP